MKFDYTYITLFGYTVFEPMVMLTNMIFLVLTILFAKRLLSFPMVYAKQMALFILSLGLGMIVGAIGHAVHEQAGKGFFNLILVVMNVFSLFSVFFCFRGCLILTNGRKEPKVWLVLVGIILMVMLVVSVMRADFTIIKIMAGSVLIFALIAHYRDWNKTGRIGNKWVIAGILVSFLSLVAHTLHISLHAWFNHKDLSHVIMIVGIVTIYKGIRKNSESMVAAGI